MKRWTHRDINGVAHINAGHCEAAAYMAAIQKLADFEDAQEQGRLDILPPAWDVNHAAANPFGALSNAQISDLRKIGETYENNIGVVPPSVTLEFREYYLERGLTVSVIIKAIETAAENNARAWPYIKRILERCVMEKIITAEDWRQAELRKHGRRGAGKFSAAPREASYDLAELEKLIDRGVF